MSTLPELIDGTVRALEELKRAGVTHVEVSPETLAALAEPVPLARSGAAGAAPSQTVSCVRESAISETGGRRSGGAAAATTGFDDAAWRDLRAAALACRKCHELAAARHQVVFGAGNQRAELLFIGEAPGRDEDLAGEPFVGRAGELLTKIIQAMGFQRHEVYIANVLKCRPPENRVPEPDEVANCRPFLEKQIELIQPQVIVALGATALRALLDVQIGITKMRGNWYTYRGIPIMPTFHPAYLLRNPAAKRDVWQDMQAVVKKLGREVPKNTTR